MQMPITSLLPWLTLSSRPLPATSFHVSTRQLHNITPSHTFTARSPFIISHYLTTHCTQLQIKIQRKDDIDSLTKQLLTQRTSTLSSPTQSTQCHLFSITLPFIPISPYENHLPRPQITNPNQPSTPSLANKKRRVLLTEVPNLRLRKSRSEYQPEPARKRMPCTCERKCK
jgi:hypothetical protein